MDNEVVAAKLESLRRCVGRIRDKTPDSAELLAADYDRQDIISLNLQRAVQACVDIAAHLVTDSAAPPPATMAAGFAALHSLGILSEELAERMQKAVGFRNIAVHSYQEIDWEIVYAIITTRLDDFSAFARRVDELLSAPEN